MKKILRGQTETQAPRQKACRSMSVHRNDCFRAGPTTTLKPLSNRSALEDLNSRPSEVATTPCNRTARVHQARSQIQDQHLDPSAWNAIGATKEPTSDALRTPETLRNGALPASRKPHPDGRAAKWWPGEACRANCLGEDSGDAQTAVDGMRPSPVGTTTDPRILALGKTGLGDVQPGDCVRIDPDSFIQREDICRCRRGVRQESECWGWDAQARTRPLSARACT